jgi:phenylacetate-CoA ligase
MRIKLLDLYHGLPSSLRSAAATGHGAYLRWWRYGARTNSLCAEALRRDDWTAEQWQKWREERLAYLLDRAARRVPYYKRHWSERRRLGDRASWDLLANWPILEKDILRANAADFVADDRSVSRMFHDHTSGTSGKSLDLWLSRDTVQAWYALFEARCRQWNGVARHDRWAIIGGQLIAAVNQATPPFWAWNASLHQLYLSAYHLAPRHIASYINALRRYRVRYIVGYPSALHTLAREALRQRLDVPSLAFILTNAEPLLPGQRVEIEEAFGCPVRETYGMAEIVAGASECSEGRMHIWPELGEIELIGGNGADGGVGELVCTGLLNDDMPLIRYRVGDRGSIAATGESCACGRKLPILTSIEGRVDDALLTADGRVVGRLDPVFKSGLPILEAQIIQDALNVIRIRYVPAEGFSAASRESLVDRVRERLGAVKVVLEELDAIPRTANGKFRAVICNLSPEERAGAQSF